MVHIMPWGSLVAALLSLPTIALQLKSLEVKFVLHLYACAFNVDFVFRRYVEYNFAIPVFPEFPVIPANLESITFEPAVVAAHCELFVASILSLRNIRFGSHHHHVLPLIITPLRRRSLPALNYTAPHLITRPGHFLLN